MMYRTYVYSFRAFATLLLLSGFGQAFAAPPAPEQLLPIGTTEFVAIQDVNRMTASWHQTQFAQMMRDPALQPFLNDLYDRTKGFNYLLDTIGADFEAVKAAAGGELGWAVVLVSPNEVAHVLTLDMTGHTTETNALLAEISKKLGDRGGKGEKRMLDGVMTSIIVTLPSKRQIVYGVKDNLLVIADHLSTVQGMLQRWVGATNNSLASTPAYQGVRRKASMKSGETEMIRFFFEPIARTEAQMIYFPEMKRVKGDNLAQALRKEGVDGIKGVGGSLAFVNNGTDMLIRIATYAPQPFRGAMRMATFPNNAAVAPEAWVPADVSAHFSIGLDLVNAYDSFETLFERLADEPPGTFKDIMERVRVDKDGPQCDIRREIMQQLQPRLTMISDAARPIGEHSDRYLFAVPVVSPEGEAILTKALQKCFESDRRIKSRQFAGVQGWEYQPRQQRKPSSKQAKVGLPALAFTVARGHLFIATQAPLLEKVLSYTGPSLAESADYKRFAGEMVRLGMGPSSSRSFIRMDAATESAFEMLKLNKLDKADSTIALLLKKTLADETGKLKVDGSKLPPYPGVSKFLGLAGSYMSTDVNGWTITGAVIKK
jgi:hypothetical protein